MRPLLCKLSLLLLLLLIPVGGMAQSESADEDVDVRALFGVTDDVPEVTAPVSDGSAAVPQVDAPDPSTPSPAMNTAPQTPDVIAPPPAADSVPAASLEPEKTWENKKTVVLRALDKVTARTQTMDIRVGEVLQFGDIYIRPQSCREPPAIFTAESAAFIQVWDIPPGQTDSRWVFSGWMFASSPALSAMDHPVYDVWVLDCKN